MLVVDGDFRRPQMHKYFHGESEPNVGSLEANCTAADVDDGDFYQTSVDRRGIRPGTMYYDPNGHVLVVYDIRPDGDILMFDGHPDNSLSHRRFSARLPYR